jgi:protein involved in polysaccharide export with SLBB domain
VPLSSSSAKYAIGDRLKLVFYEHMSTGDSSDGASVLSGLVERAELTGEYVVQQDGRLTLPLLGSVDIEGQGVEGARNLEDAFREVFGREAKVSIITTERDPVYVIGPSGRSGTFKYTPGMSVIHAVAMSGAIEGDRAEFYLRAEQIRAVERAEQSEQKLERLLPKLGVLRGEQAGGSSEPPTALVELVGATKASVLMDTARRVRALTLESRQPLFEVHRAAIAAARRENTELTRKLAALQRQIGAYEQRRSIINDLRQRGSGTPYIYYQSEVELTQAQEREPEIAIALSASQLRIEQAQQELAKLEGDTRADRGREIATLEEEIQEQQLAIRASQRLIADARVASLRLEPGLQNVSFTIVRRSREGVQRIAALEDTELMPGDLVRVSNNSVPSGN